MGQGNSKLRITESDRAILKLKKSKDEIHRYTRRTDQLLSEERERLKQLIRENPSTYREDRKIRFLLKRIHYQEQLLDQASDQLINLENMVATLEYKTVEMQFLEGLKRGNEILTKLNREFKGVDELMDDVQNQIAYQNEIDETLSRRIAGIDNYEEEVDRELDALERSINPSPKISLPSTENLPELKPVVQKEDRETNEVEPEAKLDSNVLEDPLEA